MRLAIDGTHCAQLRAELEPKMTILLIAREYLAIRRRACIVAPSDCWAIATFRVTGEWPVLPA